MGGERPTALGLGLCAIAHAALWTVLTTDVRRRTAREGHARAPGALA